jgi:hypothetical protein
MAQYLPLPDGSSITIRPGETPEQAWARAQQQYPEAFQPALPAFNFASPQTEVEELPPPEPKRGMLSSLVGGAKRMASTGQTALESIIDPEGAARRGVERGQGIGQQYAPGADWDRVAQAYREKGLLSAAGETLSQIPSAVMEQLPQIGVTLGGAKAGALAGSAFGPVGTVVGGGLGAITPSLLQLYGANVERQAEAQQEAGEELDISRGRALGAAVPGAALEAAATLIPFGRAAVGKLLGPEAARYLAAPAGREIVEESLKRVLTKGAVIGTAAEVPTEVTQQMLERLQAGLPLTSDEALAEYGRAAYGAALVGAPVGSFGRTYQRSVARGEKEAEEAEAARVAQEEAARAEAERLASPAYLTDVETRYNALREQIAQQPRLERPKRPQSATPEQELQYEEQLAAYKEAKARQDALLARFQPVRDEYQAALPRIQQQRQERQAAEEARAQEIEVSAARDQPMAADLFRTPGEQTVLPGFAEPSPVGDAATVLAAERDRRLYGREGRQAELEGVFDEADQRDLLTETPETPDLMRARLEREIRGIEDIRDRLREQGLQTTDPAALRQLAEQDRALQAAQQRAAQQMAEVPAIEAGPTLKSVDDRIKRLQKQLQNAQETGDLGKAASAAEALQAAQQERAGMAEQRPFAAGTFRDTGGVSESVDEFNQRVVGPEIGAEREARAAQEAQRQAVVGAEAEALQRINQREDATPYIQQARQELGTRREIETMERQAAMDTQRTRQPDLFSGQVPEARTPSRTTPEALERLVTRAENSPNLPVQDRMLLDDVKDVLPAMVQSPDRAQLDVVSDWLYRSAMGQPSAERRGDVESLIGQLQQGRLSETDRQTEVQQRALTKEEKRALQGLTPGMKPGPVTNMTNRRGVMERTPTGPEMRAAQQELPGVEPTATAFRDFREFEDYLASTGLAQVRDAMGIEGDTIARQTRNLEGLERSVANIRKQIADVIQRRDAARVAPEAERASARTLLQESEATLLELQRSLDAELIGAQIRYLEAAKNAAEAQQVAADLAQQVSDNVAQLEQQIAQYEQQVGARDQRIQALRAAQAKLKALVDEQAADKQAMATGLDNISKGLPFEPNNRIYFDAKLRVINRKGPMVAAHQQLMQANAAIPAMPKLSSTVFRDFLIEDANLQTQLATAQRRLGGLNSAKSKAKTALDDAFRAQQASPEVIKALGDARSDVEVASQLSEAAAQNVQATIAPFEQELARLGRVAEPLIRRVEEIKRNLPKAAEARRRQSEAAKTTSLRQQREERLKQARQEREEQARIVAGEIETPGAARVRVDGAEQPLTPREKVTFPAKERRYQTLDRILSRLSWQDPQTEVALKQWVAKQDRLQGEFDKRTAELIEEQIQRIEDYAKFKEQFPRQKANHAKREAVIRNQSKALAKRLDWVGSKASGTTEARPAGEAVVRERMQSREERQAAADRTLRETRAAPRTEAQQIQLDAALARVRTVLASSKPQGEKDTLIDAVFTRFPNLPLTREQVLELAQYIPGRAIGPATKRQSAAPSEFRTGADTATRSAATVRSDGALETVKGSESSTRTNPRNPIREARGVPQRNTPVGSPDMQEANRLAAEMQAAKTPEQKQADVAKAEKIAKRRGKKAAEQTPKQPKTKREKVIEEALLYEDETSASDDAFAQIDVDVGIDADIEASGLGQGDFDSLFDSTDNFSATRDSTVYDERPTVRLNDEAMDAARDGRILDLLDNLAQNASTPFARELAKRLRPLVMKTKLRTIDGGVFDEAGNPVEGAFRPRTNTVELSDSALFEETVLHEISHAVTVNQLDADINTLTPEQRQARQELEALLTQVRKDPAFDKQYGRLNSKELVAELLSNQDFRDRLDKMKPSLLRRIYNAMLRFFGMTPQSVSERAVENAYALFAPSKVSSGNAVASVLRGVFPGSGAKYGSAVPQSVRDIVAPPVANSKLGQKISSAALGFRTLALDRWAPMEYLIKLGVSKGKLSEVQAQQMRIHMRLHEDTNRFAAQSLTNGVVQLQEDNGKRYYGGEASDVNMRTVVRQINEAGDALGNSEARLELWQRWMEINRVERKGLGYDVINTKKPMTAAEAQQIKALVNGNAAIKQAFENARETYKQYNRDLMRQAAEAGTLPADVAKNLAEMDYIPFYRVDGDAVVLDGVGSKPFTVGSLLDQPYLKELVGDSRERLPVLDAVVQNTSMLTKMNIRNLQSKDAANLIQQMGMGKVVKGEGPANVLRFKSDGDMYWLKLEPDAFPEGMTPEMLLSGMQGVKAAVPTVLKLAGIPTQMLRATITRMPLYVVRQMIRDPLFAWMTTGGKFTPVVSSIKELTKIRRGMSPTEEKLARSGAISSNVMTGDYQDVARMLRDISIDQKGWNWAMAALDKFAMQADASTRAVLYDAYRKEGMDHVDAMLGAAESMNFSRRGTSSSLFMWSTLVPFFNAQLQGIDALYRAAKGDTIYQKKMDVRNTLFKRGLLMLGATIAYSALMQEDEAYKNATPEERAMNWFVRLPGMEDAIRVPIPFEPGLIFKAIPEAIFNAAYGDDTAKDAMKAIGKQLWMSTPLQLPAAINPVIELATNYSFFTDSPIESQRERAMDSEQRYREGTTELAKMLGKTGVASPIQIEHLVRGYFSSAGILAMSMANYPLRPLVSPDGPERPELKLSQMPLFGPAFQPATGRGAINTAYDDVLRFQRAHQTFNAMVERGNMAEARAYANEFAREIALASTGGAFRQQMGELAKLRRQISASALSPSEKRERLEEIRRFEIQLAQQVRSMSRGS